MSRSENLILCLFFGKACGFRVHLVGLKTDCSGYPTVCYTTRFFNHLHSQMLNVCTTRKLGNRTLWWPVSVMAGPYAPHESANLAPRSSGQRFTTICHLLTECWKPDTIAFAVRCRPFVVTVTDQDKKFDFLQKNTARLLLPPSV